MIISYILNILNSKKIFTIGCKALRRKKAAKQKNEINKKIIEIK
jgi:hypothetical protein